MREFILENLMDTTSLTLASVLLNNVVAIVAAFFIMFVYKFTYAGVAYSRKFNITLGAVTIATTMIMGVISNNIALSLGMVGALSIIRFRTAIKDARDAAFIFWAIAVGIGCGVSQYTLVGIGSLFLFLFMILTKKGIASGRQLLIVQSDIASQNEVEAVVERHFDGGAHRTIKNMSDFGCEIVYCVPENLLKKANKKNQVDIAEALMKIGGVTRVNLVEQQDDISR